MKNLWITWTFVQSSCSHYKSHRQAVRKAWLTVWIFLENFFSCNFYRKFGSADSADDTRLLVKKKKKKKKKLGRQIQRTLQNFWRRIRRRRKRWRWVSGFSGHHRTCEEEEKEEEEEDGSSDSADIAELVKKKKKKKMGVQIQRTSQSL